MEQWKDCWKSESEMKSDIEDLRLLLKKGYHRCNFNFNLLTPEEIEINNRMDNMVEIYCKAFDPEIIKLHLKKGKYGDIEKIENIQKIAADLGINIDGMDKITAIRHIQKAKGHLECYATVAACLRKCCWSRSCWYLYKEINMLQNS